MRTIQLQIENESIAQKILAILNVFKDDGVSIKTITKTDTQMTKDEFNEDIKQAFYELKTNQGQKTDKFVDIEI